MANIAFFDFDGTITNSDTFTKFVFKTIDKKRLKTGKFIIAPYFLGYKIGIVSGAKIRSKIVKVGFAGVLEIELRKQGRMYSENYLPNVLRENAMQKIDWHKQQGDKIVVVSASMDVYLQPWCEQYQLELLCSEIECKNGVVTGNYIHSDCSGEMKKRRILEQYDLTQYPEIYVYGDTEEDFAMLSLGTQKTYQWQPFKTK